MKSSTEYAIADRIIEARKESDMTQEKMAEKLNISVNAYAKYERAITIPPTKKIIEIAEISGFSIDYLLLGKKESEELDAVTFLKKYRNALDTVIENLQ